MQTAARKFTPAMRLHGGIVDEKSRGVLRTVPVLAQGKSWLRLFGQRPAEVK